MAWPTRLRRQSPGEVYTSVPINPFLQRGRPGGGGSCTMPRLSGFFFLFFFFFFGGLFSLLHLFFVLFASCGGQKAWVGWGGGGGRGGGRGSGGGGRFCGYSSIHCIFRFFLLLELVS